MGTFITYQIVTVILLFLRLSHSLPDRESDITHPGHVVLHPPSDLTTVYIGDGDVYFYWSPPQNYPTHEPENLTNSEVHRIHDIDEVHFSDSGTWLDKASLSDKNREWSLNFFYDLHHKLSGMGHSEPEKDHDGTSQSNITVEEHIVQSNLTEEQMERVRQHYASKNISDVPDWFKKTTVPREHAGILFYTIFWQEMINGTEGETQNSTVEASQLDYHIKGLKARTVYRISVEVMYYSFTTLRSKYLEITTNKNYSLIHTEDYMDTCSCNKLGTSSGSSDCKFHNFGTLTLKLCQCKEGYSGMYCHICASGYYRLGPNMPCYKCPCGSLKSDGHCHFEEGYLFCDTCKEGYTGNLCQACADGYYRLHGSAKCTPCNCHGNAQLCQDLTGECIGCMYNTAGFNCNRCRPGYVNVLKSYQFHHSKCVLASTANEMQGKGEMNSLSSGAIAGICVTIIIIVGLVIGIVIYRRYWRYPTARPFWTVELKDDHEGISFSSVPEDELVAITAREEAESYQDRKRGKPGSQPYAKLRENI